MKIREILRTEFGLVRTTSRQEVAVLRLLFAALACSTFLHAVDPEDHVRKSTPVTSATRLVLNADVGSIRVQSGIERTVDVDVVFRGLHPPARSSIECAAISRWMLHNKAPIFE